MKDKTPIAGTFRGFGAIARLSVIALMLLTTLFALPAATSARTSGMSGLFAQASQQANPAAAAKTPEADDEETPEDEEEKPSKKKTPVADDEELNEDWVDAGLVSSTEYESPQFEYTVEWDEPWVLDDWYDDPSNGDTATGTVVTDKQDGDDLHIWVEDSGAILHVQGMANDNELTGEDYVEYWDSSDYYDGFASPTEAIQVEGDEEGAAAIYWIDGDKGAFIGYNQVIVADDGATLIFLLLLVPAEDFEDSYAECQDGVLLNGDESFDVFSDRDIKDAVDGVLASG